MLSLKKQGLKELIDFDHWKGLPHKCERYEQDNFIKELYEKKHVHADVICKYSCNRSKCAYKEQFKTKAPLVLMPWNYVYTHYIDRFDCIFIDESFLHHQKFIWSFTEKLFRRFIEMVEEFNKRYGCNFYTKYLHGWLKIFSHYHRYLQSSVSILTDEEIEKNELFDNFMNKEWWQRLDERYITSKIDNINKTIRVAHAKEIENMSDYDTMGKIVRIWHPDAKGKRKYLTSQIQKMIKKGIKAKNLDFIGVLVKIPSYFDFFWKIWNQGTKTGVWVTEKLKLTTTDELGLKVSGNGKQNEIKTDYHNGQIYIQRGNDVIISTGEKYKGKGKEISVHGLVSIGRPYLFDVFDLVAQGKKVVMTDAIFNKILFTQLLKRWKRVIAFKKSDYYKEATGEDVSGYDVDLVSNYAIKEFDFKNKNSKVIGVIPNNLSGSNWTQLTIENYANSDEFHRRLLNIKKAVKDKGKTIAAIGFKKHLTEKGEFFKIVKFDTGLNFYVQAGRNDLRDYDIGMVFSTPNISITNLIKDYVLLTGEYPSDISKTRNGNALRGFQHRDLNEYYSTLVLGEMYNAIHRFRLLLKVGKEVYVFGRVPNRIKEELEYKEWTWDMAYHHLTNYKDEILKIHKKIEWIKNIIATSHRKNEEERDWREWAIMAISLNLQIPPEEAEEIYEECIRKYYQKV